MSSHSWVGEGALGAGAVLGTITIGLALLALVVGGCAGSAADSDLHKRASRAADGRTSPEPSAPAERGAVVQIASQPLSASIVEHWRAVIEHGGGFGGARGEAHGTFEQRAVALLISSTWLIDEAASEGVAVSDAATARALRGRARSEGFERAVRASGEALADVRFELRAELSLAALLRRLERRAASVTPRELADYYRAQRQRFATPETRNADLLESFHNPAEATTTATNLGIGRRFAARAIHEHVRRHTTMEATPEKVRLISAIYAARPGVLSHPFRLEHLWVVFVLRSVQPPGYEPLAQVRNELEATLRASRLERLTRQFDAQYRARWTAQTSCRRGYVAPGCAQYKGPLGAYEDPFAGG